MSIEYVESIESKNIKRTDDNSVNVEEVKGVIFCKTCGKQYDEKYIGYGDCPLCGSIDFIKGNIAATLAGYVKLDSTGNLKKYYKEKYGKNSILKMNSKRIILWLLIKEGLIDVNDKEIEKSIGLIMRKKF